MVPELYPSSDNQFNIGLSNRKICDFYVNTVHYNSLSQLSDIKTKENVKPLQNSLSKLMQLEGISYDYKMKYYQHDKDSIKNPEFLSKMEKRRKNHYGFNAQQVKNNIIWFITGRIVCCL